MIGRWVGRVYEAACAVCASIFQMQRPVETEEHCEGGYVCCGTRAPLTPWTCPRCRDEDVHKEAA